MGFDPISIAIFAATAASAVSGYSAQNKAAKATKNANAAAMAAAEEEAKLVKEDAAFAARQEKKDAARLRGQQIAAFLRSGVTLDGSPLLVATETEEQGKLNAENIIKNAESKAKSIILKGQAGQQYVEKPDIFGTAATILGSGQTAFKK